MGLFSAKYTLDEHDKGINRVFERIVIVLAFLQILSPLVASFLCLVGVEMDMLNITIIVMIFFIIVEIISFAFNIVFMKLKKPSLFQIIGITLLLWLFLIAFLNTNLRWL